MRKLNYLIILLIGGLTLSSCATAVKHKSNPMPTAKSLGNEGIVYFYRPKSFIGMMISYNVKEGDRVIGPIKNGTYFYNRTSPGSHTYTAATEAKAEKTINVEKGKTYYVKCGLKMGLLAGRPSMTLVAESEGKTAVEKLTYATKK